MSEIGPTRVRSRRPCRMISCPAANGIRDSSAAPSSTEPPSGTKRATASRIERSLVIPSGVHPESLPPLPLGLALFGEGGQALGGVLAGEEAEDLRALQG